MANTITNTRLYCTKNRVRQYLTLASDGTEETDYVVYDSSDAAAAMQGGAITDPTDSTILSIKATSSCAATARIKLEFDATTDVLALDIPPGQPVEIDFKEFGGLKNTAGSGITGDITLTTTGLEAGDALTIILEVKPN